MTEQFARVDELRRSLIDEIATVLGLSPSGLPRKLLSPLFWPAAHRFSKLAARFDQAVAEMGLREAARWVLPHFVPGVQVRGTEAIPHEGPLLVASNHPGTVDSLAILANLPRDDVKVVASGLPFVRALPGIRRHLIYIPREGLGRTTALREALRHLDADGALLIFPSGRVDPDPAILPGAYEALSTWSRSLDLILHRLPNTRVLPTIVSGVLSPKWLHHPLVWIRRGAREQQLLAEFLQVIQQMVFGLRSSSMPQVTFGSSVTAAELDRGDGSTSFLGSIVERAQRLLAEHCEISSCSPQLAGPGQARL
jgi:hypothetical protein